MSDALCSLEMMRYSEDPLLKVMQLPPIPPCSLIADAASRCPCRARWKASTWFLLDWSYWCHQEICSEKTIQRQTVHYFPAGYINISPKWSCLWQGQFWNGISRFISCGFRKFSSACFVLCRCLIFWTEHVPSSHIQYVCLFVIICIMHIMIIVSLISIIDMQCLCWICMRMSEPNQETGFLLAGFQCMMKAGTNARGRDSIRRPPANFDCTISVG